MGAFKGVAGKLIEYKIHKRIMARIIIKAKATALNRTLTASLLLPRLMGKRFCYGAH